MFPNALIQGSPQSENNILKSLVFVKHYLIELKFSMSTMLSYPDEKTMIQRLQNDGKWMVDCLDPSYKILKDAKKEFVDWFYLLTYCNFKCRIQIEEILSKRKVSLSTFCSFVARVYSSIKIDLTYFFKWYYDTIISLSEEEEGLNIYGLKDKRFINCLKVIRDIRDLKYFNLELISTSDDGTFTSSSNIQQTQDVPKKKKKKVPQQKVKKQASSQNKKTTIFPQKQRKEITKEKVSQTPTVLLHNVNHIDSKLSKKAKKNFKCHSRQLQGNKIVINNYSIVFK